MIRRKRRFFRICPTLAGGCVSCQKRNWSFANLQRCFIRANEIVPGSSSAREPHLHECAPQPVEDLGPLIGAMPHSKLERFQNGTVTNAPEPTNCDRLPPRSLTGNETKTKVFTRTENSIEPFRTFTHLRRPRHNCSYSNPIQPAHSYGVLPLQTPPNAPYIR